MPLRLQHTTGSCEDRVETLNESCVRASVLEHGSVCVSSQNCQTQVRLSAKCAVKHMTCNGSPTCHTYAGVWCTMRDLHDPGASMAGSLLAGCVSAGYAHLYVTLQCNTFVYNPCRCPMPTVDPMTARVARTEVHMSLGPNQARFVIYLGTETASGSYSNKTLNFAV